MQKKARLIIVVLILIVFCLSGNAQEEYLSITADVTPQRVTQGNEGVLIVKIVPRSGIQISSHPNFMIVLDPNDNLTFSKLFFTAAELNVETRAENETVFLDLEKKNEIRFKVNDSALIGRLNITGEIVFTAVFKDNWSLKTHQKFSASFFINKNERIKKK